MENISEAQSEQLDRYLRGEMPVAERSAFEASLLSDAALHAAFVARRDLVWGMREATRHQFEQLVHHELDVFEQTERRKRIERYRQWGLAAVAILAIGGLGGWYFWTRKETSVPLPSPQGIVLPADSTNSNQQIDTALLSPKKQKTPAQRKKLDTIDKKSKANPPEVPVANIQQTKDLRRDQVAAAPQVPLAALKALPLRVVLLSGDKKTNTQQPNAVLLEVFSTDTMQCTFSGNKIRLFVPKTFAEGQLVEMVELRGTGEADGYYLKVGSKVYPMKNARGNPFHLELATEATTLRLLLD